MMAIETFPWDAAEYLDSDEMILAYLEAVFEDGDPQLIALALNDIARARGLSDLGAVTKTVKALGFELTAKAA
jgi:probable addiction module antidote protein